jgi:hypothetical protein
MVPVKRHPPSTAVAREGSRYFVAYAHLYIIGYLSKIVEWKSQFACHFVEWKSQNTTKPAL